MIADDGETCSVTFDGYGTTVIVKVPDSLVALHCPQARVFPAPSSYQSSAPRAGMRRIRMRDPGRGGMVCREGRTPSEWQLPLTTCHDTRASLGIAVRSCSMAILLPPFSTCRQRRQELQELKKKKALKKQARMSEIEHFREQEKHRWKDFTQKVGVVLKHQSPVPQFTSCVPSPHHTHTLLHPEMPKVN